ncbi:hypothetical protein E8K88_14875 [Lampropedia aestuarii]|uniref:Uncharacterized protein n=1 Tax=Lampropedia aestuarii TaxID=2562762 RepID=A0A4V3YWI8_9BURK|nr:hypothetical protein [Lampropedia aestuarii]MDH5858295.1 hypothetical protein [Lampropedia aestuarii]THJ31442.1 hypothetical protein E8K88_14875 [Lampropedia aestuarii]
MMVLPTAMVHDWRSPLHLQTINSLCQPAWFMDAVCRIHYYLIDWQTPDGVCAPFSLLLAFETAKETP